uniref:Uncharacterized protein n=1 Tax=Acrobeloides nanus TaxID=290746 RepID=A0A914CNT6_9BILA
MEKCLNIACPKIDSISTETLAISNKIDAIPKPTYANVVATDASNAAQVILTRKVMREEDDRPNREKSLIIKNVKPDADMGEFISSLCSKIDGVGDQDTIKASIKAFPLVKKKPVITFRFVTPSKEVAIKLLRAIPKLRDTDPQFELLTARPDYTSTELQVFREQISKTDGRCYRKSGEFQRFLCSSAYYGKHLFCHFSWRRRPFRVKTKLYKGSWIDFIFEMASMTANGIPAPGVEPNKASAEDHKKKSTTSKKENIVKQAQQLNSNRLLRNRKLDHRSSKNNCFSFQTSLQESSHWELMHMNKNIVRLNKTQGASCSKKIGSECDGSCCGGGFCCGDGSCCSGGFRGLYK